jgi:glycerate 2-kinase
MKIIIAPDKFKGSLTAFEVCRSVEAGIKSIDSSIEIISFPMADGGDGFASILQAYLHTETIFCKTVDPLYRPIDGTYQWNEKTKTAIIEMAVASGLVLLKDNERNPFLTSTYGTGLLIKDAINNGADKIILGIGGSATNDGGIGILEALGFKIMDGNDQPLKGMGESLNKITAIVPPILKDVRFEIACDVQNILYGLNGASFVYSPQKGADKEQVKILDDGLKNLAKVLLKETGKDIANIAGTGAAGGIAASLLCYFNTELKQGVDMVIEASGTHRLLDNVNLVITGEGKIDHQSLDGKVIGKIATLANEKNIPVIAFCGRLDLTENEIIGTGLEEAYVIGESLSVEESMKQAAKLLTEKTKVNLKRFFDRVK